MKTNDGSSLTWTSKLISVDGIKSNTFEFKVNWKGYTGIVLCKNVVINVEVR